jgi:hypothetical protein
MVAFTDDLQLFLLVSIHFPHELSRIIAASLGIYMIMMYLAASLTSSKVESTILCQTSRSIPSVQRRRNGVRAESPNLATVADNSERGKRGRDAASKSARFCNTCLVPKPPRYSDCINICIMIFCSHAWVQAVTTVAYATPASTVWTITVSQNQSCLRVVRVFCCVYLKFY